MAARAVFIHDKSVLCRAKGSGGYRTEGGRRRTEFGSRNAEGGMRKEDKIMETAKARTG